MYLKNQRSKKKELTKFANIFMSESFPVLHHPADVYSPHIRVNYILPVDRCLFNYNKRDLALNLILKWFQVILEEECRITGYLKEMLHGHWLILIAKPYNKLIWNCRRDCTEQAVFEQTCAYAWWAHMHRFVSVCQAAHGFPHGVQSCEFARCMSASRSLQIASPQVA